MTAYLCTGKSCRKKKADYCALRDQLEQCTEVREVGCQKCCSGPVVGIEVRGRIEWFSKLRTGSRRRDLLDAVRDGTMAKSLKKRREKKRSGKVR